MGTEAGRPSRGLRDLACCGSIGCGSCMLSCLLCAASAGMGALRPIRSRLDGCCSCKWSCLQCLASVLQEWTSMLGLLQGPFAVTCPAAACPFTHCQHDPLNVEARQLLLA